MDCWQILDLAPTDDLRAIKRAYLAGLKRHRPDDDLAAFQQVQQAYEAAQVLARSPWLWPQTPEVPETPEVAAPQAPEPEGPVASSLPSQPPPPDPGDRADPLEAPPPPTLAGVDWQASAEALSRAAWQRALDTPAPADLLSLAPALWQQRPWQVPPGDAALEAALFGPWAGFLERPQRDPAQDGRLWPWLVQLALYYGWLTAGPGAAGVTPGRRQDWMRVLAAASVRAVMACEAEGGGPPGGLTAQLAHPLFQSLDLRHALAQAWAQALTDADPWPEALAEAVFAAFDWVREPQACPPVLLARRARHRDAGLLARIASGAEAHDGIDRTTAQALLAPRIGWHQWHQGVEPVWHLRMNRALIWLHENAPSALQAVAPAVRRWWTSPRPQASDLWVVAALLGWVSVTLWTVDRLKPLQPDGWVWLAVLLPVMAASGMAGYLGARGLAWLRVQWALRLYRPWCTWDRRLVHRTPLLRRWVDRRDIGPTRDLLPLAALGAAQLLQLPAHPDAQTLGVGVGTVLLLGWVWRGVLRWLGSPPGALHWLSLRDAGVAQ